MAIKTIETRAIISAQDKTGSTFSAVSQKMRGLEQTATSASRRMDSLARGMSAVGAATAARARLHDAIARGMGGGAVATGAAVAATASAGARARAAGIAIRDRASEFAGYALPGVAGSMLGMGGAAVGGLAVGGAATYGLRQAVTFDKAMADVKKKVNLDPGATWDDVEGMINRTARETGKSREEMAALAAAAGQAGVAYKDLGEFMRLAAKAASAWDMDAKEAAQNLANIKTQTGWANRELEQFADKVNALGDSTASGERDVLGMFKRSSAAAKASGLPLDTTLAFTTALNSAGMAEEVAARFTAAFSSKLRTATHGTKQAKEALKEIGLTPKGVEDGMRKDATRTILDVLGRIDGAKDKASVSTRLFGNEWWDEAARAGQVVPEVRKNLSLLSGKSWEGSLSKNLATDLATTSKHLERFGALTSEVGDRLTRWALPGINAQLERTLKAFDVADKTGFLAGPDGKPIDRVADKTPVPFGEANRALFLRGQRPGDAFAISGERPRQIPQWQTWLSATAGAATSAIADSPANVWGNWKKLSAMADRLEADKLPGAVKAERLFGSGAARSGILNFGAGGPVAPMAAPVAKLEGTAAIDIKVEVAPTTDFLVKVAQQLQASGALRSDVGVSMPQ